jgi:hypothetical protein
MFEEFPGVLKALEIPQAHTVGLGRNSIRVVTLFWWNDPEKRLVAVRPGARRFDGRAASNLPENRNLFPDGLDTETIVCQKTTSEMEEPSARRRDRRTTPATGSTRNLIHGREVTDPAVEWRAAAGPTSCFI